MDLLEKSPRLCWKVSLFVILILLGSPFSPFQALGQSEQDLLHPDNNRGPSSSPPFFWQLNQWAAAQKNLQFSDLQSLFVHFNEVSPIFVTPVVSPNGTNSTPGVVITPSEGLAPDLPAPLEATFKIIPGVKTYQLWIKASPGAVVATVKFTIEEGGLKIVPSLGDGVDIKISGAINEVQDEITFRIEGLPRGTGSLELYGVLYGVASGPAFLSYDIQTGPYPPFPQQIQVNGQVPSLHAPVKVTPETLISWENTPLSGPGWAIVTEGFSEPTRFEIRIADAAKPGIALKWVPVPLDPITHLPMRSIDVATLMKQAGLEGKGGKFVIQVIAQGVTGLEKWSRNWAIVEVEVPPISIPTVVTGVKIFGGIPGGEEIAIPIASGYMPPEGATFAVVAEGQEGEIAATLENDALVIPAGTLPTGEIVLRIKVTDREGQTRVSDSSVIVTVLGPLEKPQVTVLGSTINGIIRVPVTEVPLMVPSIQVGGGYHQGDGTTFTVRWDGSGQKGEVKGLQLDTNGNLVGKDGNFWIIPSMLPVGEVTLSVTAVGTEEPMRISEPDSVKIKVFDRPRIVITGASTVNQEGTAANLVEGEPVKIQIQNYKSDGQYRIQIGIATVPLMVGKTQWGIGDQPIEILLDGTGEITITGLPPATQAYSIAILDDIIVSEKSVEVTVNPRPIELPVPQINFLPGAKIFGGIPGGEEVAIPIASGYVPPEEATFAVVVEGQEGEITVTLESNAGNSVLMIPAGTLPVGEVSLRIKVTDNEGHTSISESPVTVTILGPLETPQVSVVGSTNNGITRVPVTEAPTIQIGGEYHQGDGTTFTLQWKAGEQSGKFENLQLDQNGNLVNQNGGPVIPVDLLSMPLGEVTLTITAITTAPDQPTRISESVSVKINVFGPPRISLLHGDDGGKSLVIRKGDSVVVELDGYTLLGNYSVNVTGVGGGSFTLPEIGKEGSLNNMTFKVREGGDTWVLVEISGLSEGPHTISVFDEDLPADQSLEVNVLKVEKPNMTPPKGPFIFGEDVVLLLTNYTFMGEYTLTIAGVTVPLHLWEKVELGNTGAETEMRVTIASDGSRLTVVILHNLPANTYTAIIADETERSDEIPIQVLEPFKPGQVIVSGGMTVNGETRIPVTQSVPIQIVGYQPPPGVELTAQWVAGGGQSGAFVNLRLDKNGFLVDQSGKPAISAVTLPVGKIVLTITATHSGRELGQVPQTLHIFGPPQITVNKNTLTETESQTKGIILTIENYDPLGQYAVQVGTDYGIMINSGEVVLTVRLKKEDIQLIVSDDGKKANIIIKGLPAGTYPIRVADQGLFANTVDPVTIIQSVLEVPVIGWTSGSRIVVGDQDVVIPIQTKYKPSDGMKFSVVVESGTGSGLRSQTINAVLGEDGKLRIPAGSLPLGGVTLTVKVVDPTGKNTLAQFQPVTIQVAGPPELEVVGNATITEGETATILIKNYSQEGKYDITIVLPLLPGEQFHRMTAIIGLSPNEDGVSVFVNGVEVKVKLEKNGIVTISGLPPGEYRIRVDDSGIFGGVVHITVNPKVEPPPAKPTLVVGEPLPSDLSVTAQGQFDPNSEESNGYVILAPVEGKIQFAIVDQNHIVLFIGTAAESDSQDLITKVAHWINPMITRVQRHDALANIAHSFQNRELSPELIKTTLMAMFDYAGLNEITITLEDVRSQSSLELASSMLDSLTSADQQAILNFITMSDSQKGLWLKMKVLQQMQGRMSSPQKLQSALFLAHAFENTPALLLFDRYDQRVNGTWTNDLEEFFRISFGFITEVIRDPSIDKEKKKEIAIAVGALPVFIQREILIKLDNGMSGRGIDSLYRAIDRLISAINSDTPQPGVIDLGIQNLIQEDELAVAFVEGFLAHRSELETKLLNEPEDGSVFSINILSDYEAILTTYLVDVISGIEDSSTKARAKQAVVTAFKLDEKATQIWLQHGVLVLNATKTFGEQDLDLIEEYLANFSGSGFLKVITARNSLEEPVDIPPGVMGFTFDLWNGAISIAGLSTERFSNAQSFTLTLIHEDIHLRDFYTMKPENRDEVEEIATRATDYDWSFLPEEARGSSEELLAYTGAGGDGSNWFLDSFRFLNDDFDSSDGTPRNNSLNRLELALILADETAFFESDGSEYIWLIQVDKRGHITKTKARISRQFIAGRYRIVSITAPNGSVWLISWDEQGNIEGIQHG